MCYECDWRTEDADRWGLTGAAREYHIRPSLPNFEWPTDSFTMTFGD